MEFPMTTKLTQCLALAALALATMCHSSPALAAPMETTIWTLECTTTKQTRKIRVVAEDRETARGMAEKEVVRSGFCQAYNLVFVKVEVEK
jgi:hypothetical protein